MKISTKKRTAAAALGGAIGAAIAASRADSYIMAANQDRVRVFGMDKMAGGCTGEYTEFRYQDIKKGIAGGFLGAFDVMIKTDTEKHEYTTNGKFHGHIQKEEIAKMKELLKSRFGSSKT